MEKFLPDKKDDDENDTPLDTIAPRTDRVNVRDGRHTIVEMIPERESDSEDENQQDNSDS